MTFGPEIAVEHDARVKKVWIAVLEGMAPEPKHKERREVRRNGDVSCRENREHRTHLRASSHFNGAVGSSDCTRLCAMLT